MNRQEITSAIRDFRSAFRDDLGTLVDYGKLESTTSGGFSIDKKQETLNWLSETPDGEKLYGTISLGSAEEVEEYGLNQMSTGIVTCIYEDILSIQGEMDDIVTLKKEDVLDDLLRVYIRGKVQVYRIIDFSLSFQLKDTFIFIKFGVVDVNEGEIPNG